MNTIGLRKSKTAKVLSFVIAIIMVLCMLPLASMKAEGTTTFTVSLQPKAGATGVPENYSIDVKVVDTDGTTEIAANQHLNGPGTVTVDIPTDKIDVYKLRITDTQKAGWSMKYNGTEINTNETIDFNDAGITANTIKFELEPTATPPSPGGGGGGGASAGDIQFNMSNPQNGVTKLVLANSTETSIEGNMTVYASDITGGNQTLKIKATPNSGQSLNASNIRMFIDGTNQGTAIAEALTGPTHEYSFSYDSSKIYTFEIAYNAPLGPEPGPGGGGGGPQANAGDVRLEVLNSAGGLVQYSVDGGSSWTNVTEFNGNNEAIINKSDIPTVTGNKVYFKLTPDTAYDVGGTVNGNELTDTDITKLKAGTYYIDYSATAINDFGAAFHISKCYFIWNDNGTICKYEVTGLLPSKIVGENVVYPVTYIDAATVVDGEHTLDLAKAISTGYYYFIYYDKISVIDGKANWYALEDYFNELDRTDHDMFKTIAVDPAQAENGNNSISTNGDRNFRATITDTTKYEAVTFNVDPASYDYFLSSWDSQFISPELDLYGTTKEAPAEYNTYMLEPSLKFENSSESIKQIQSVTALDINPAAVTITKVGQQFTVVFNSNFYDKVVLDIAYDDNTHSYLEVNRIVSETNDNMREMQDGIYSSPKVMFDLIYPSTTNYTDYEVVATLQYKDGTTKATTAEVGYIRVMDPAGDHDEIVVSGGKNLKTTRYLVDVDEYVVAVNFNVIHKSSDASKFGGIFAGSGTGIQMNVEEFVSDVFGRRED